MSVPSARELVDAFYSEVRDRSDVTRVVLWSFRALAVVAVLAFFALALLFALTIPYHDWDSFSYGEWSRRIARSHAFDPAPVGPYPAGRPLFFVLQGLLWRITGVSFVAGRLLSLLFAVIAVVGTAMLLGRREGRLFALVAFLSITVFSVEAVAGKTDVPAAAAVAAVTAVALQDPFHRQARLVGILTVAAVLTKPSSVIPALVGLVLALLVTEQLRSRRDVLESRATATVVGLVVGLIYEWAMAIHFHMGLVAFLRAGTTGYYAQLADTVRWDTLLRLDFLGPDLRLPLAFTLVYACCRAVRVVIRVHRLRAAARGHPARPVGPRAQRDTPDATASYHRAAVLGVALWTSLVSFDGFHEPLWVEWRERLLGADAPVEVFAVAIKAAPTEPAA